MIILDERQKVKSYLSNKNLFLTKQFFYLRKKLIFTYNIV